ncbi:rare lipoprotein A [Sphaerotilus hippei]|uniref:Endolytic peptidoglycan transglycosylase RlpA n=1 Tax=Sphaerotilus hippei TaxID=744406 RepID=A0A318H101_9BURK|nr:rare lipoprotein A [Sphaerotilus hippei]
MQASLLRHSPATLATLAVATAALLTACGSAPPRGASGASRPSASVPPVTPRYTDRDGPPVNPPAGLADTPDPQPVIEPVRVGGPNKPYEIAGQTYVPTRVDLPVIQRGLASWYGTKFHGKRTASGEVYNMYAMTAAHPTLPIPSYARVRNLSNGREVIVRINDRGPFHSNRIIDLSYTAALKLDLLKGVKTVELERITHEAIRNAQWQGQGGGQRMAQSPDEAESIEPVITAPAQPGRDQGRPPIETDLRPAAGEERVSAVAPSPAPAAEAVRRPTAPRPERSVNARTHAAAATTGAATVSAATPPPPPKAVAAPVALPVAALAELLPAPTARALPAERAGTTAARGWWLQLGAFNNHEGAAKFHRQVADVVHWLDPLMTLFKDQSLHKLQAGPFGSRDEAQRFSARLREAIQLSPVLVERR